MYIYAAVAYSSRICRQSMAYMYRPKYVFHVYSLQFLSSEASKVLDEVIHWQCGSFGLLKWLQLNISEVRGQKAV